VNWYTCIIHFPNHINPVQYFHTRAETRDDAERHALEWATEPAFPDVSVEHVFNGKLEANTDYSSDEPVKLAAPPAPAKACAASEAENKSLRRLLWLRHASDHIGYGDDGEMQCSRCRIDFKRDSAEQIDKRFAEMGMAKITAAAALAAGEQAVAAEQGEGASQERESGEAGAE
jgi:hypothetical protein